LTFEIKIYSVKGAEEITVKVSALICHRCSG